MDYLKKTQTAINNIRSRCRNPNNGHYHSYGGRGIQCHWNTVREFRRDMLDALIEAHEKYPNDKLSIDRIDNDGDYCKENCQWIPIGENSRKDNKGKPKSQAHRLAMSKERKGKPQTPARAEALRGIHERKRKRILMTKKYEPICCFLSIKDASVFVGTPAQNINEILLRKGYRKTARGYSFDYL